MRSRRWMAGALLAGGVILTACSGGGGGSAAEPEAPATLTEVPGKPDIKLITLTDDAIERIGLETGKVSSRVGLDGTSQRVVPFASLIYDAEGATYVYVTEEHAQFQREPVKVERISGDDVLISDGPTAGTAVVTVGAAELLGVESDFEEE